MTFNTKIQLALLFSSLYFFSSCANHAGYLSSNAVITNSDFKIIGLAVGEAQSTKVFWLGGNRKNALVLDAKNDLYAKNKLESGQALTNITVDFKHGYYIFFATTKVFVSGEIIDFNVGKDTTTPIFYGIRERNGLGLKEEIYAQIDDKFTVCTIQKLELDKVLVGTSLDSITEIKYKNAYKLSGSYSHKKTPYTIGDTMKSIYVEGNNSALKDIGKVVGISTQKALIFDEKLKKFIVIDIDKK